MFNNASELSQVATLSEDLESKKNLLQGYNAKIQKLMKIRELQVH